jgi:anti-sigma factor RsiW
MPPVSEPHVQHDLLLVASLAAGDLAGADRDHAAAQIASCADCAILHADLIAISRATAALPPAVAPRDFTLSREQATALRPTGWRRLVAAMSGSRPLMSRQLGIGFATIGLAGLLVSVLPTVQLGSSAALPAAPPAASAAAAQQAPGVVAGPAGTSDLAGEAASGPPVQLAPVPTGTYDRSAAGAASSPNDVGVYGTSKGASPTPEDLDGRIAVGANPTNGIAGDGAASESQTFGKGSIQSDDGRGLLLAGSLVLLWAGIAMLIIRTLVRRSVRR